MNPAPPSPCVDAIALAGQLGRLDLVSALLAIVAIILVLAGLFAFGFVRGQASATAKATAEKITEERLRTLTRELREMLERGTQKPSLDAPDTSHSDANVEDAATVASEYEDRTRRES